MLTARIIADMMPRKKHGDTSFGEGLQAIVGVTPPRVERVKMIRRRVACGRDFKLALREQKAIIRPINSFVAVGSARRNVAQGERNGR